MEIGKRLNNSGNLVISLKDKRRITMFDRFGELKSSFKVKGTNMFLTEIKRNNAIDSERKFIISIRQDGINNDYKMSQMEFNENELNELKDCIEDMITYKNENDTKHKPLVESNFEEVLDKQYKVWFKESISSIGEEYSNRSLQHVKYIEGYMENFNPSNNAVLYSEEYGFNIIPCNNIVQMLEIKE